VRRLGSEIRKGAAYEATESLMDSPKVATPKEWLAAREQLLAKEKEFTHQREALAAARRRMPAVKVENKYVFEGPRGDLRGSFRGPPAAHHLSPDVRTDPDDCL
jgi:hypothetical protein